MARVGRCAGCGESAKLRKMRLSDEYLCRRCASERQFETYESSKTAYKRNRLHPGPKPRPDFDTLFELFSSDCTTFTEIGEQFGLTCERVRQIYWKYFAKLIPRRPDGHTRRKVCTRKRRVSGAVSRFHSMSCFIPLIQEVKRHRVKAESVLGKSTTFSFRISTRFMRLNGHLCLVKRNSKILNNNTRSCWHFSCWSRQGEEFLILQAGPEGTTKYRFFVVPSRLVPARKSIFIPVNGWSMYHNIGPTINWFEYENRWDLLAPLVPPSASPKA